jgi:hypothetical protein
MADEQKESGLTDGDIALEPHKEPRQEDTTPAPPKRKPGRKWFWILALAVLLALFCLLLIRHHRN